MAFASTNPATGEVEATFDNISESQIEDALVASWAAHKTLKSWSMEDRKAAMHRIADILEDEADRLGAIITLEMGKTLKSAIGEVKKCAMGCRYYADHAESMMADEVVEATDAQTYKKYLPLGPIMVVMPWNYPLWQVYRFVAPALMAGNTGLLKHASNVPQCSLSVEDVVRRAGFPEGSLQSMFITTDQVGDILRDDRVRGATLTGSEGAGSSVASICGEVIKPTVLELGGSDAFIVMPSADLDKAVEVAVTARTQNCGQSCIAGKRFIIHADIYDEFKAKFKVGFEALVVGDPNSPATDIGPMVTESARDEIAKQVENAIKDGAARVTGAEVIDGPGFFYRPGILEHIQQSSNAYHEEIFGPVALLFKVHSIEEAIELANDSPFGLGSSIFTQDSDEQAFAINEIEAGATFVNSMTASHPALPFGGVKRSGYGRELAAEGLRAFCNIKTVSIS
ncbi:succinate-semialdehyde dehydrogenase [Litorimonas cladophorae]|uniref:Succinate-semialdehyde dehydrogenase n=1 Tax=Litorimonas cladophorae TaxID=1220491 RepID=A0A918NEU8_9PROT|nr:NAD-dependent succinate-semialdehyde dehydrogenase [Litorimonas cladophorae]GGX61952.1 succinate-semialdehyde dehydrogenase [Litorimonas cladophorae]